ncbi:pyridoxine 5'-phosphate synthase [Citreimonas salinaria]|uniref:Pyridoxine 5-phosphate synthase n=1 Tax=Citreimonas salinaria TaxID=321339 RepID=A0A1H3L1U8_9RHOB|nr:pyridoxine 5'-phosphate synthase [Citreimonas salinaria]SDY57865.1 pyridoxine 5-phosphate synthase [Citreimonas salinaria]
MTLLSVNLEAAVFLRSRRSVPWPEPIAIVRAVLAEGAEGITVPPRPDGRHIRYPEGFDLSHPVQTKFPETETKPQTHV